MDLNMLNGSYPTMHEDSSSDAESTTSTVHLERKKRKPLMEKKRRARINASLDQLKKLVLDAMKKDSARYSKLEKADILELTVRHLREGQQQHMNVAMTQDTSVATKYKAGFTECASEVSRYLSTIDGLSHEVRLRLMQHLSHCVQRIEPHQPTSSSPVSSPHMHLIQNAPSQYQQAPVQPLQIQIPAATTPTSLPGMTRCSPEPGNLPPTPPSSAGDHQHHSFNSSSNTSFHFLSADTSPYPPQQQQQLPYMPAHYPPTPNNSSGPHQHYPLMSLPPQQDNTPPMPLKSRENLSKLPSLNHHHGKSVRYSPYHIKKEYLASGKKSPVFGGHNIKEENMWRPW